MKTSPLFTNRLVNEKSPYLLQHAHNPVDWYPWGEEAFEKARSEHKPIFLSVGYSTCHWCHVMEHESFESEATAKLLNENYVSIKVDREERPDVDRVYMTFVQATTGSGGWPMSVFLTPDLKPFVGGTYFPPEDRHGRPGFPTVLTHLAHAWKSDAAGIIAQGDRILATLREHMASAGESERVPGGETLKAGYDQIARNFDDELGGFGAAPKFPRPVTLNFLARVYARQHDKRALEMNLLTLRKMAEGGMHDHLGGGFHRYSVDRFWHIPHFENMLYDQAQLAIAYLEAFQITHDPLYERVARDILDYVRRDMTSEEGGFFSAEDADSLFEHGKPEHGEGAYYVWTEAEIDNALDPDAAKMFKRFYGVESLGNAPDGSDPHGEFLGKNTLIQRHTTAEMVKLFERTSEEIEASLMESRRKLFELRAKRPRPHLDDKIITAWNGLMLSAFARASQVLDDPACLSSATRAASFIRAELTRNGTLIRSHRNGPGEVGGFADDYAFLIQGLLDLYEASFDIGWLRWATELQIKQDELFADHEQGGYFAVTKNDTSILLRMKEDYDGAEPSANSVAALNLLRLAQMTGNPDFQRAAGKTMGAFAAQLRNIPGAMPQMLVAVEFALKKPKQIVVAGNRDAEDTRALLREVHRHFIPNKVLLLADGGEGQQFLSERLEFLQTITPIDGRATAYLCEDYACSLPTNDPATLAEMLAAGAASKMP